VPAPRWLLASLVSLAATVLSWRPVAWAKVAPGLDPSWQAGLAEAFEHRLQWGPQIVFTFGPYGFVDTLMPFYWATTLLTVVFALVVSWGLAYLVTSTLWPSWGLLPAGAVAWGVLAVADSRTGYADLASALALGLALGALGPGEAERRRALWVGLLGALAGFLLLTKFNDGLVAAGLLTLAVAGQVFRGGVPALARALGAGVAALAAVTLAAWAAAGQSLSNLASYFRGSWAVAAGYSSAMGLSQGRRAEDFFAAAALGFLAGTYYLVASRWHQGAGVNACLAVALAGWCWATLKEGFVRHDAHDLTFFGLVLAAIALAGVSRRALAVQAGSLAAVAAFFCLAAGAPPVQLHSPGASAGALATDLRSAVGLASSRRLEERLRSQLVAAGNSLPPSALRLVSGRSVAIEPADEAVAYVYPQLDWRPEPVLQGYSAYTAYLDRLDSSFLASRGAPERVVYEPGQVIDGRDPWMGPPGALVSMYCHYRQVGVAGVWQVLARSWGRGRCGPARLVSIARARFGEAVAVPHVAGEMVAATLSFSLPLGYGIEEVALRPPAMQVEIWPAGGKPAVYRFVPGTAGDLHVLATPPALGYSRAFTPPAVREIALLGGGWAKGQGQVTLHFYAIRI